MGAAGTATIKVLLASGVRDIVGVDEHGTIHRGRTGRLADARGRADVFIGREYIIPSVFNKAVAPAVAAGVARAAHETGTARRRRRRDLAGMP